MAVWPKAPEEQDVRDRISNVFTRIEDITYIGLGIWYCFRPAP